MSIILQGGGSLESIKNLTNGQERYEEFKELMPIVHRYNTFILAKNIGVKYGPGDLSYEDLNYFTALNPKDTKGRKHGKK